MAFPTARSVSPAPPAPARSPNPTTDVAGQAVDRLVAGLVADQRPDGGWGAIAGGPATTEATAFVALALASTRGVVAARSVEMDAAARRGVTWLVAHQRPDGSWPATELVAEPSWMTSVALLALARSGPADDARARALTGGATWLLGERVFEYPWQVRLGLAWLRLRGQAPVSNSDADDALTGWPWVEGTYSWVEPTSLALLALRAGAGVVPTIARGRRYTDRVRIAERMLVDRMTPGGGWNYGNTRVFGQDLEPYPDTTAWALLALRGAGADADVRRVVRAGVDRLPALLDGNHSSLARSLAALAVRAHGGSDDAWRASVASRVATVGPPPDARSRALALLALAGPSLPFGG